METIFIVNLAVSLVMAAGLWLVWRQDPAQRFARSMAWATLAYGAMGLAYLLWKHPQPLQHALGKVLLPVAASAMYVHVFAGVVYLRGWTPQRTHLLSLATAVFVSYFALVGTGHYTWLGYMNLAFWLSSGLLSLRVLWGSGWLARLVGFLLLGIGINAGFLVHFGEAGLVMMFSVGLVLRVALGFVLMSAAMVRTHQKTGQAKARYKALSQNAPMGIAVASAQGLLYANPAAARIGGYASVEALLADDAWALLPEPDNTLAREQLRKLLSGEQDLLETACQCTNKAGQRVHLKVSAWRMEWDGQLAVQLVFNDETQQAVAEQAFKSLQHQYEQQRAEFAERSKNALLKANAELEARVAQRTRELQEASQAKSQFLASMSHEIRTPMNVVLGLLELLQATSQTPLQTDYTYKAKRAARSLLALLNDLLDFSKIDAGKMQLELLPFSMERLLRDLSNMCPAMVGNKPVEVLFDIDPTLPDVFRGDAMRLQQVMLNLLSNAIKFTAEGEVVVQLLVCQRSPQEATLRLSVRDTGIGIAPENQRHIFEVFAQAESSITRRFGGSGLGLAICKKLLALMHSDLRLESQVDTGSCFYFELTLPLADRAALEADPLEAATTARDLSVLVVDDNDAARTLTLTMARGLGWAVEAVPSGAAALARVEALRASGQRLFDAILVDWKMQPLDGWETLRRLHALYPAGKPPVCIMASAYGREAMVERPAQDQALLSAYLTKPVTASMLGDAVHSACLSVGTNNPPRPKAPKGVRLQGLRILLVEDNPLNQLVARELLSAEGVQVTAVDNGALGLAQLTANPRAFDAVLMDMQMPVMDGCTATRAIRKSLQLAHLPIIAMTANTLQSDKEACLAAGMNDHVGKPFDIGHLVDVIRKQCGLPPYSADAAPAAVPVGAPEEQAFDVETAIAALEGDRALYAQILRAFLDELGGLPAALGAQLEAGDRVAAKRTLHTLKGTAATVGALALSRMARAAEAQVAQTQGVDDDAAVVGRLQASAQDAVRQLAAWAYAE